MNFDIDKSLQTVNWEDTITCRVCAEVQQSVFKTILSAEDTTILMAEVLRSTRKLFVDAMALGLVDEAVTVAIGRRIKGVFWYRRGDRPRLTIYHD